MVFEASLFDAQTLLTFQDLARYYLNQENKPSLLGIAPLLWMDFFEGIHNLHSLEDLVSYLQQKSRCVEIFQENFLMTGYFEPTLKGSFVQQGAFQTPLYKRPPELVVVEDLGVLAHSLAGKRVAGILKEGTLQPAWKRAEVVAGALHGRGLELVWLQEPLDAFFVQVQGCCLIESADRAPVRLSYDGVNGHAYVSIGRVLIAEEGYDADQMSMQQIYAFCHLYPARVQEFLNRNPSYVFFKENPAFTVGPQGLLGIQLRARQALAVDPQVIPLGLPLLLTADSPLGSFSHLTASLDVGGAIKGQRLDYYWGSGAEAGAHAGTTHHTAHVQALIPKEAHYEGS